MRFVDANAKINRKLFEGLNIHTIIEDGVLTIIVISKLIDLADGYKIVSRQNILPKHFQINNLINRSTFE